MSTDTDNLRLFERTCAPWAQERTYGNALRPANSEGDEGAQVPEGWERRPVPARKQKRNKKGLDSYRNSDILISAMAETRRTITDILRDAAQADGRSIFALARDAGIPYAVMYRFLKGDRDGKKSGLNLTTADKLVRALGPELRPVERE